MLMDMGFRDLFRPKPTPPAERADPPPRTRSEAEHERLMAWAHAMETGALAVPDDVHDGEAWDRYWRTQIEVGAIEQGFNDMMASDPKLVSLLIERGATSILCAGNGLSAEAYALALHGFAVTALDIAPILAPAFRGAYIDGPGDAGVDVARGWRDGGPGRPDRCRVLSVDPSRRGRPAARRRFAAVRDRGPDGSRRLPGPL